MEVTLNQVRNTPRTPTRSLDPRGKKMANYCSIQDETCEFPPKGRTLGDILKWRAKSQPNRLAFAFLADGEREEENWNYAELDQRARVIASNLMSKKLTGERALLLYPSGMEFVAAFFGCLYAGVVAVPCNVPRANRPANRALGIANDCTPAVILTDCASYPVVEKAIQPYCASNNAILMETDSMCAMDYEEVESQASPDDLAFLQYTSGSTADPKGVQVSNRNIMHNAELIRQAMEFDSESIVVSWLPIFHDMGLAGCIFQPIYSGVPCTLMAPNAFFQRPVRWLQAMSRYRATHSGGPNSAFELCIKTVSQDELRQLDLSSWRIAWNGAEPVRSQSLQQFTATFSECGFRYRSHFPCYGMAETTLMVSGSTSLNGPRVLQLDAMALESHHIEMADGKREPRTIVSCGRPGPGMTIKILGPSELRQCSSNEIGEICVNGQSVTRGYWNQPVDSSTSFIKDDDGNGEFFLRTGDLGFIHDGELFVCGRSKEVIIIRGRNVYAHDIEQFVEQSHEGIQPTAVAAFAVESNGVEGIGLCVELTRSARRTDPKIIVDAVRTAVLTNCEQCPSMIALLAPGELPRTSSGKVQRQVCRQRVLDGSMQCLFTWNSQPPTAGANEIIDSLHDSTSTPIPVTRAKPSRLHSIAPRIISGGRVTELQWRHFVLFEIVPAVVTMCVLLMSWWVRPTPSSLLALLVMHVLTGTGVTVGFHRHFTHKSFDATQPIRALLAILGMMAAPGPLVTWVSIHRRHHQESDEEGDPHSPNLFDSTRWGRLKGLWHAQLGWLAEHPLPNPMHYAPDLAKDALVMRVNRGYHAWVILGLLIPGIACGIIDRSWSSAAWGIIIGGVVRLFVSHHIISSVNSICHAFGRRSFETREHSTNNLWLAVPTLGEAWHNNHHAFQWSAMFGFQWYEVDFGGWVIRVLERLGLAWNVRVPTQEMRNQRSEKPVKANNNSSISPKIETIGEQESHMGLTSSSLEISAARLTQLIARCLEKPNSAVRSTDKLTSLQLDSLSISQLLLEIEQEFAVRIPIEQFLATDTVAALANEVVKNANGSLRIENHCENQAIARSEDRKDALMVPGAGDKIQPTQSERDSNRCSYRERWAKMTARFNLMRAEGQYFYEPTIESINATHATVDGQSLLNLACYSYLGLLGDSRITDAARTALETFGTGTSNARLGAGTTTIHVALEKKIAEFTQRESALVFPNGFGTNTSVIATLIEPGDVVLVDALAHASIVDGAKLSGASLETFVHNDMTDLEVKLSRAGAARKLVVVDGVYSMDGDIANLPVISFLCKKYDALLMVDEAHSLGVIGTKGRGIEEHFGMAPGTVDILMGTLSKTVPANGGFVAGCTELIEMLRHNARGYVFSGGLSPALAAAALKSFEIIEEEPERVARLQNNARRLREGLNAVGFDTFASQTAVIPVRCADTESALRMTGRLRELGALVFPVVYPVVPTNAPRWRVCANAAMTDSDIDTAIRAFRQARDDCETLNALTLRI